MKYLYKYPQQEYPYARLVEENRRRGRQDPEFELLSTGVFDENRYFDVFVEYAKADVEDVLIRITVANRGDRDADITVLPTVWFRNTWTWEGREPDSGLRAISPAVVGLEHPELGKRWLYCDGQPE